MPRIHADDLERPPATPACALGAANAPPVEALPGPAPARAHAPELSHAPGRPPAQGSPRQRLAFRWPAGRSAGLVLWALAGCSGELLGAELLAPPWIDAGNVSRLQLGFAWRTGQVGAVDAAPAAAGGLLFLVTPFPHTVYAVDPTAAPARRIRWQYTPAADLSAAGLACCDRLGHGPVAAGGRIFFTTLDGHVVALDAATGALRFDAKVADPAAGETLAGAPLVAQGRVFVGSAGDDFGARGWIAALDLDTGRPLWKRHSTGPDREVGIGPAFKPFHAGLRAVDLGVASWSPGAWQQGGGSVAGELLYDADADVVLHGTGHAAPWNAAQRPGDGRWTSGLFARDAATGAARWFVGFNPGNPYAFRDAGNRLLFEQRWNGQPRRLVVHADANGVLYVIDRSNGQLLAADAVTETVVAGVDLPSGETRYAAAKGVTPNRQTRHVCPAWTGAFGAGASLVAGRVAESVGQRVSEAAAEAGARLAAPPAVPPAARTSALSVASPVAPPVAPPAASLAAPSGVRPAAPAVAPPIAPRAASPVVPPAARSAAPLAAPPATEDGIVALPLSKLCMDIEPRQANYLRGTPYLGGNVRLLPAAPPAGAVIGWRVAGRKPAWRVDERWPVLGGTLATPGGLVFYGTLDGKLKALDGRSGRLLWQFQAPAAIVGRPVVFQGSDARPYLAVVAGAGRLHGPARTEALDPRDAGAGLGLAGLLAQLPHDEDPSGTLLVFRLP